MITPHHLSTQFVAVHVLALGALLTSCTPSPPPARSTHAAAPHSQPAPEPRDAGVRDVSTRDVSLDGPSSRDAATDDPYTKLVVLPPTDYKPSWELDAGPDACSQRPKLPKNIPVWWKSPEKKVFKLSRRDPLHEDSFGCCGPQNVGRLNSLTFEGVGREFTYGWNPTCLSRYYGYNKPMRVEPGKVVFSFASHDEAPWPCNELVVLSRGCEVERHGQHLFLHPHVCLALRHDCIEPWYQPGASHAAPAGSTARLSATVTCTAELEPGNYMVHFTTTRSVRIGNTDSYPIEKYIYPLTVPGVFRGDMWNRPPCRQQAGWGRICTDEEWRADEAGRRANKERCDRKIQKWERRKRERERERERGW